MPWAKSGSSKIYFEVAGEGKPLLLLHCMPLNHTIWTYQFVRYSKHYKVICPDFRSLGMSDKPESPCTISDLVQDVRSVLRALNLNSAVVAGVSIGGETALQYALSHPGEVEGLILSGCVANAKDQFLQKRFADLKSGYLTPDFSTHYKKHILTLLSKAFQNSKLGSYFIQNFNEMAPDLKGRPISRIYEALLNLDLSDRLHEITAPTLVITGEEDVALKWCRELAKEIHDAEFIKIQNAGHVVCLENPMGYDKYVLTFLSDLRR